MSISEVVLGPSQGLGCGHDDGVGGERQRDGGGGGDGHGRIGVGCGAVEPGERFRDDGDGVRSEWGEVEFSGSGEERRLEGFHNTRLKAG